MVFLSLLEVVFLRVSNLVSLLIWVFRWFRMVLWFDSCWDRKNCVSMKIDNRKMMISRSVVIVFMKLG